MDKLKLHKKEAYENAIDSMARYKFMQFGYWAAIWVHLNQIDKEQESNPFKSYVELAKHQIEVNDGQGELETIFNKL